MGINQSSKIIISGDLNDTPDDKSLAEILKAKPNSDAHDPISLYNLAPTYCKTTTGTYKYREEWSCLDQIIVSGSILNNDGIFTTNTNAHIFNQPFLLEEDTKYHGNKPFRTYTGMRYNGGFSDHLPVYLDLYSK